jgi:hypothetical protein
MRQRTPLIFALVALVALGNLWPASTSAQDEHPGLDVFFAAISADRGAANDALKVLEENWRPGYAPMMIEFIRFLKRGTGVSTGGMIAGGGDRVIDADGLGGDRNRDGIDTDRFASRRDPRVQATERVIKFVEDRTGQDFGDDYDAWRDWMWKQEYEPHPQYGTLKANLYANIDPNFQKFFQGESAIRLDEVDWGGVGVSGIPALDHPATVSANAASYLADSDIVFGVSVGGAHRAYPKRILAWHELAWDNVGDVELTVVYCTLCGTVIPYNSEVGGRVVKFDTSGLLYRSNKLLYDDISNTLWSSITGEPVIGPMVGYDVKLTPNAAVTTTWGEWKATHPDTTVLSLDTGFERDYSEGAAYAAYFATDELMFGVPETDSRLPNKAEVLALRFDTTSGTRALAISADYLAQNRVFQTNFAGRDLVVVTSPDGANRVYAASGYKFQSMDASGKLVDTEGGTWVANEDLLVPDSDPTGGLTRLPAFRAFWFGWFGQYPDTELIGN